MRAAFPLPAQEFRSAWIREVSGGVDSWVLLNVRELGVAGVDMSVAQVPGSVGSVDGSGRRQGC